MSNGGERNDKAKELDMDGYCISLISWRLSMSCL